MAQCSVCGDYYRITPFNTTQVCESCIFEAESSEELDPDTALDIFNLKNPHGKTPARYTEIDLEDDSFGS